MTPERYDQLARSACFVCQIVAGEPLVGDVHVVYEDDHAIAFLNQFPTQEGYTLVSPKRHVERYERDFSAEEWLHLQTVVHSVSGAVAKATDPIRMYIASLGSPERNAHLHVHICPCPQGTPFREQQFAAMQTKDGAYLQLSPHRMAEIAESIRTALDTGGSTRIA
jgi:diadenosine tetraphosphate (Ap4A) HIT family hydrolase